MFSSSRVYAKLGQTDLCSNTRTSSYLKTVASHFQPSCLT